MPSCYGNCFLCKGLEFVSYFSSYNYITLIVIVDDRKHIFLDFVCNPAPLFLPLVLILNSLNKAINPDASIPGILVIRYRYCPIGGILIIDFLEYELLSFHVLNRYNIVFLGRFIPGYYGLQKFCSLFFRACIYVKVIIKILHL